MTKKNPLLTESELPLFKQILPEHIEPAVEQVLTENRAQIAAMLNQPINQWDDLIPPLEILDDRLHKVWSPVSHMHSVVSSEPLRKAYNACLPKLTSYHTEISQNIQLYQAYKSLAEKPEAKQFNPAQQKLLHDDLRDFHLSGVDLPPEAKKRYAEIRKRLAELTTKFEENILDTTENWIKHVEDSTVLAGIPDHVLEIAKKTAQEKKLSGWVLNLDFPCYFPILSYADNRELRKELYTAYSTRASDQGPSAKRFDNSSVMTEILALRRELSTLLGFANYAELSLATKMVKQPQRVLDFLYDLAKQARPKAIKDLEELKEFAYQTDKITDLQSWDIPYYSEKLSSQRYGINDELLRPYFPENRVIEGLFSLTQQLYGVHIVEEKGIEAWHPDVRFFSIYDKDNKLRGQFYLDLYARSQKRSGAWMDDCQQRWRKPNGEVQPPIAFLTCNLTPPAGGKPALLTHDEVSTLFHEFGHGLHHMLTKVDYASLAGIRGVEWDAVELPSQFMEFFIWEKPVLKFISGHFQSGEPLPDNLLQQLRAAKNFQSGLQVLRQLEFAIFDFRLHLATESSFTTEFVQQVLNEVRKEIAVLVPPDWNRFQHSFSHIFAGGYAAGYYSYLWAEMLASDAYAKFEENGIINPEIGKEFLTTILERGGSGEALTLFTRFRGREPKIDALLKHLGLKDTS